MSYRIIFTIVIIFATSIVANACMCTYAGTFLEVANKKENIIHVKVLKVKTKTEYPYMDVKIIEVLKGGLKKNKKIKIYGQNGYNCLASINRMKPNDELVIALNSDNVFGLPSCGTYHLKIKGTQVGGLVDKDFGNAAKASYKPKWNGKQIEWAILKKKIKEMSQ